jgi:hypothetical protein
VNIKDKAVRWLAMRWLAGEIKAWRKDSGVMGKIATLLDGNKRTIVTIGFVLSGLVAMLTGQDVGGWLDIALRALGWSDAGVIASAKEVATQLVPLLFAIWAAVGGLLKMWKQWKAGATPVEINSPAGVIKAAVADGSLQVVQPTEAKRATLELEGAPVVAKVGDATVTA